MRKTVKNERKRSESEQETNFTAKEKFYICVKA